MKPSLFYGTAVSTILGLALGLGLHSTWQSHEGGPQVLIASAAADELARVRGDSDIIETSAPAADPTAAYADISWLDAGQGPANSLPMVRLTRMGGPPRPAAEDIQRVSSGAAADDTDAVTTVGDFKEEAANALDHAAARPFMTASYTPGDAAF